MKHVIIGTAGHVDHGKTTLIQALTGINADRLKEEQERGMTIDIGFASLKLPDGTVAGIVDVPGHERFLKNMLAGVSGVDVVLLVVAADEGIMPQTREHLDILRLLDVKNGVVALTKMDMVEKEWTDVVEEDVRSHLAGTFLADAPIIRVSARTGKGVEALKKALQAAVSRAEERSASLPFRLPVDRVFTRPGFGTVVTGTLVAGTLHVGDAAEILPSQIATRVRGLQVHGQKVTEAFAGSRVAVNLAGVETDALERGAQIAPPGALSPTTTFDALLRLLPDGPKILEDRERVRVHLGTLEVLGRIRLLDAHNELAPEERAYIQFRGETEFACARGDRFVVRSYSPMAVIGGGVILDAHPTRHRKADADALAALEAKERGTPEDLVETVLQRCAVGMIRAEVAGAAGLASPDAEAAVEALRLAGRVFILPGDRVFDVAILNTLTTRAIVALETYHSQFPLRAGLPREELRAALGKQVDGRAFTSLLAYWQKKDVVALEGATVRKAGFQVELNERQQTMLARIEQMYQTCSVATPSVEEVATELRTTADGVTALLKVGEGQGKFARVEDGVYYHAATIDFIKQTVAEYLREHDSISVGEFRDLTHTNRKYALQALEYLDTVRFTRRTGDTRMLY